MKKEILMLIIGILIGAVITTGIFLVLKSNDSSNANDMERGMNGRPDMDGNFVMDENMRGGNMPNGTIPEEVISE